MASGWTSGLYRDGAGGNYPTAFVKCRAPWFEIIEIPFTTRSPWRIMLIYLNKYTLLLGLCLKMCKKPLFCWNEEVANLQYWEGFTLRKQILNLHWANQWPLKRNTIFLLSLPIGDPKAFFKLSIGKGPCIAWWKGGMDWAKLGWHFHQRFKEGLMIPFRYYFTAIIWIGSTTITTPNTISLVLPPDEGRCLERRTVFISIAPYM